MTRNQDRLWDGFVKVQYSNSRGRTKRKIFLDLNDTRSMRKSKASSYSTTTTLPRKERPLSPAGIKGRGVSPLRAETGGLRHWQGLGYAPPTDPRALRGR